MIGRRHIFQIIFLIKKYIEYVYKKVFVKNIKTMRKIFPELSKRKKKHINILLKNIFFKSVVTLKFLNLKEIHFLTTLMITNK